MNYKIVTGLALSLFLLAGCNPTKQDVGTVVGAGAGAYVGSQIGGGAPALPRPPAALDRAWGAAR